MKLKENVIGNEVLSACQYERSGSGPLSQSSPLYITGVHEAPLTYFQFYNTDIQSAYEVGARRHELTLSKGESSGEEKEISHRPRPYQQFDGPQSLPSSISRRQVGETPAEYGYVSNAHSLNVRAVGVHHLAEVSTSNCSTTRSPESGSKKEFHLDSGCLGGGWDVLNRRGWLMASPNRNKREDS